MRRGLELLAPAKTADIGIAAIMHGADAVYIGPEGFGARKSAANSTDDIRRLVETAHTYRARVYATVNTIVHEHELQHVERLIRDLYLAGVDALIVQDMGILRMDLPPIELHASTQCDTRTPEKALFLEKAGFSQIVLARELTLEQIREICHTVSVPVECFVHGALCVSYSGRCHASQWCMGRSANRGECAQMCRLPYTLTDGASRVLARDKYLLSLRDLNASSLLADMVEAGVSSFKIEGRLKDAAYVKNVTAAYSRLLDEIVAHNPDKYVRTSVGRCSVSFTPDLSKSFNRGFTTHFLSTPGRTSGRASLQTPKSLGEPIADASVLHNGDGVSWFDKSGRYVGARVNSVERGNVLLAAERGASTLRLPKDIALHRTFDHEFNKQVEASRGERTIFFDIEIDRQGVTAIDERGCRVRVPLDVDMQDARTPQQMRRVFEKTGDTPYRLRSFDNRLDDDVFIPASQLTKVRRGVIEALDRAGRCTYPLSLRRGEDASFRYMTDTLDYRDNVSNHMAESFWRDHGVERIEPAMEAGSGEREENQVLAQSGQASLKKQKVRQMRQGKERKEESKVLMTCRYCILAELGRCLKGKDPAQPPFTLTTGPHTFILRPDCKACEMQILSKTTK